MANSSRSNEFDGNDEYFDALDELLEENGITAGFDPMAVMQQSASPQRELDSIRLSVSSLMRTDGLEGHPMLLWPGSIDEASRDEDIDRVNAPVPSHEEAARVIREPMMWYYRMVESCAPSAKRDGDYLEVSRRDIPNFSIDSGALAGVTAVVANATMTTRWAEGAANMLLAIRETAKFLSAIADRDGEGYDYLRHIVMKFRVYMDSLARNADPIAAEDIVRDVVETATIQDFQPNPLMMVELLSSILAFARYDDTRMLVYDAVAQVTRTMEQYARETGVFDQPADGSLRGDQVAAEADHNPELLKSLAIELSNDADNVDSSDEQVLKDRQRQLAIMAWAQFQSSMRFFRHDLMLMSGDYSSAEQMLREDISFPPFADGLAVTYIAGEQWEDLLDLADRILAVNPNQENAMFPSDLVPYGWGSLREAALQALDNRRELIKLYRGRIIQARELSHANLRAIEQLDALCHKNWSAQMKTIIRSWERDGDHTVRNRVYEYILVTEERHDAIVQYLSTFDATPVYQDLVMESDEYLDEYYFAKGRPMLDRGWEGAEHGGVR